MCNFLYFVVLMYWEEWRIIFLLNLMVRNFEECDAYLSMKDVMDEPTKIDDGYDFERMVFHGE